MFVFVQYCSPRIAIRRHGGIAAGSSSRKKSAGSGNGLAVGPNAAPAPIVSKNSIAQMMQAVFNPRSITPRLERLPWPTVYAGLTSVFSRISRRQCGHFAGVSRM
jgi:hypothetical protein